MPAKTVGGAAFHYEESGSGSPAVALLHGFPLDSRVFDAQRSALSDSFRVIAPDMMGFGYSSKPVDYRYSILDQAGSKGTGVWTVQNAVGLGVPVSGIARKQVGQVSPYVGWWPRPLARPVA